MLESAQELESVRLFSGLEDDTRTFLLQNWRVFDVYGVSEELYGVLQERV